MNIADAIKQDVNEFGRLLDTGIFSKEHIEHFLKTNPKCLDDYINKIISKYIRKKYKNETNIYLEMARYNLSRDIKKSIKYLEIYKINGGNNQDVLMLLLKLYRDEGSITKAIELADSINFDNNIERIEIIFHIYLSGNNCENNKQKFKNILMEIDKYSTNDKKHLLNKMLIDLLNKVRSENCEHIILTITENLKNLDSINKKYIANIRKDFLEYYVNLYLETADNVFMNTIRDVIKSDNNDLYHLFNKKMQLKMKGLNVSNFEEKKFLLKILKNNIDILIDSNKSQILEFLLSFHKENIYRKIKILCNLINDVNCFDLQLSRELTLLLRKIELSSCNKNRVIKILREHYKKNNNIKYKNIFLNEIEILQKKIILKSRPRSIMASLTTKCNLKCITCNGINHNGNQFYEFDSKFYNFVVENMPYLERILWQGGEVSLYEKFKELVDLAYRYGVKQNIITNLLLFDTDLINKINNYCINLQISIDAVDKKTYEEIRVGAQHESLLEKLEIFKKLRGKNKKFEYNMQTVVISKNYEQLDDLVKFAIFYNFDRVSFLKYISVQKDDLCLSDQQRIEVFNKIIYLKNKYKNISIDTNIELECNGQKFFENNLEINEQKNIKDNKNLKPGKIKDSVKHKIVCPKETEQHKSDLFCMSPWTRIYLDFKQYIRITCLSKRINIIKYKYDEIWNCKELIEYRKKIVKNDFSECNSVCRNSGEYAEQVRLGFF